MAPMGGMVGWDGFGSAIEVLRNGFNISGGELIAEVEKLKYFEDAQMEIEAKRRKLEELKRKRKQNSNHAVDGERTEGDLSDFYDDEEPEEQEP